MMTQRPRAGLRASLAAVRAAGIAGWLAFGTAVFAADPPPWAKLAEEFGKPTAGPQAAAREPDKPSASATPATANVQLGDPKAPYRYPDLGSAMEAEKKLPVYDRPISDAERMEAWQTCRSWALQKSAEYVGQQIGMGIAGVLGSRTANLPDSEVPLRKFEDQCMDRHHLKPVPVLREVRY